MDRDILTKHKAKALFDECKDYPELIEDLELYEARKLLTIAENGFRKYRSKIAKEMKSPYWMDDENYPDEYLPDRCFQYHLERTDHGEPMEYYRMKERLKERLAEIKEGKDISTDEAKEKADIKPVDKREWIEAKREELKDHFNTDDEWARHVLKLFRKEFDTTKGSITSMKSYGIYKR